MLIFINAAAFAGYTKNPILQCPKDMDPALVEQRPLAEKEKQDAAIRAKLEGYRKARETQGNNEKIWACVGSAIMTLPFACLVFYYLKAK